MVHSDSLPGYNDSLSCKLFLAVVYRAQDLISGRDIAIKLECCTQNPSDPSSLECKFQILKALDGSIRFLQPLWFGRESLYYALVLNSIATSVGDMVSSHGGHLDVSVVLTLGHQLVSI